MRRALKVVLIVFVHFIVVFTFSKSIRDKFIVMGLILGGKILGYTEASNILYHYCFAKGEPLRIDPNHFKVCPVISNKIEKMKVGENRKVVFRQSRCWRMSYALMGFELLRTSDSIFIYQHIQFDKSGKVFTYLNLFGKKLKVYDNIVHTFKCTPFVAYTSFPYKRPLKVKI